MLCLIFLSGYLFARALAPAPIPFEPNVDRLTAHQPLPQVEEEAEDVDWLALLNLHAAHGLTVAQRGDPRHNAYLALYPHLDPDAAFEDLDEPEEWEKRWTPLREQWRAVREEQARWLGVEALPKRQAHEHPITVAERVYGEEGYVDVIQKLTRQAWSPETYPKIAASLEASQERIEAVQQSLDRPHWYHPLVDVEGGEASPVAAIIKEFGGYRSLFNLLLFDAMRQVGMGQLDAAFERVLAMHRLAAHLETGPHELSLLTGYSIHGGSRSILEAIARSPHLEPEQAKRMIAELDELPAPRDPAELVRRKLVLDIIVGIVRVAEHAGEERKIEHGFFTDYGGTTLYDAAIMSLGYRWDHEVPDQPAHLWSDLLRRGWNPKLTHRRTQRLIREILAIYDSGGTLAQQTARLEVIENRLDRAAHPPRHIQSLARTFLRWVVEPRGTVQGLVEPPLLDEMFSRVWSAHRTYLRVVALTRLSRAAIAVGGYHAEHGRFPETLGDLVPIYLPRVPLNPHVDEPIGYRLQEGQARLTAWPPDLDHHDQATRDHLTLHLRR